MAEPAYNMVHLEYTSFDRHQMITQILQILTKKV